MLYFWILIISAIPVIAILSKIIKNIRRGGNPSPSEPPRRFQRKIRR